MTEKFLSSFSSFAGELEPNKDVAPQIRTRPKSDAAIPVGQPEKIVSMVWEPCLVIEFQYPPPAASLALINSVPSPSTEESNVLAGTIDVGSDMYFIVQSTVPFAERC